MSCHPSRLMLLLPTMAFLSSCATNPSECNPRNAGFIGGASGILSGCYDQRVAEKKQEYSSGQVLTQQLQSENQQLQGEKQRTTAELSDLKAQLAALQRENARLEGDLRKVQARTTAQQNQKAHLQRQLQQASQKIRESQRQAQTGSVSEDRLLQDLETLTKERDELASAIAAANVVP